MNNITVVDDFLSDEELKIVLKIIHNEKWIFGHSSQNKGDNSFNGFLQDNFPTNSVFAKFWHANLIENDIFSKLLLKKIEKTFLKKFRLDRVYANGQTFGQDGTYHQDSIEPNTFTFCLYLNQYEKKDQEVLGGYLMIKVPEEKYILSYEPTFNRGVMFPSTYFHKGNSFTRYFDDIRISVAWKLTLVENVITLVENVK